MCFSLAYFVYMWFCFDLSHTVSRVLLVMLRSWNALKKQRKVHGQWKSQSQAPRRAKLTSAMTRKKVWPRVAMVHGTINLRKRWRELWRDFGFGLFCTLIFFFRFPHFYGVLNFKKEKWLKFLQRLYCLLWAVGVSSLAGGISCWHTSQVKAWHVYKSSNGKHLQSFSTRIPVFKWINKVC